MAVVVSALAIFAMGGASRVGAQNPDTVPAEESAARSKTILQQMISALGGPAYLKVHDSECTGRLAQFGQFSGELGADAPFHESRMPPDKMRREVGKKLNIIDVYNGSQGWSLDKGGVEDGNAVAIASFQASLKLSFDVLVR
jgi:hypothetical protein